MKPRTAEVDNTMAPIDDSEAQQHTAALLRQSQARLARAQQLGRWGYWEWDVQRQTLHWSDEIYRIFGVGRDFALTYENIESMLHPEDRPANTQYVQALLTTATELASEFRIIRPQGEIRYIAQTAQVERDEAGRPLYIFGIMQDVTERKRTEQALQRSQSELATVYEHAPVMMCLLGPGREVLYANRAFTAFTGIPEAELTQGRAGDVFGCINAQEHPDGCGFGPSCRDCRLRLAIEDTLTTGQSHRGIEYRATLERAGVRRDVVLLGATARIESGESHRVLLCLEDVTASKQAEEALRVSLEKYRVLFEAFPLGITISDAQGHIVEANRASEHLLGLPTTEHIQRQIDGAEWRIVRPDGSPMPPEEYAGVRALREKRLIENVELGVFKADGDVTWLNVTAAPIPLENYGVAITYGDITLRKLAEDALRESEARYRDLVESLRRSMERATHTQNVLLALSRAAQAVQRARSPAAIYQTIGEEIDKLGYHALVFTLNDDHTELAVTYVSQVLRQLPGAPTLQQCFAVQPGGFCAQVIAAGETVFMEHGIERTDAAPAGTALALTLHLSTALGADKIISAPLKRNGRVQGLLVVMGDTLAEADVPAMEVFANQVSVALDAARALAEVQAAHERMRWLTQQIVSAQEEERKRIAQELHDELGQTLTAISFDLAAIAAALAPEQKAAVAEALAEAQTLTDYLDERVGALALDLRPAMLDDLGLAATLRWYVNTFIRRHTVNVTLETRGLETRLPPALETALYRVIQEALTNVSKHARATHVCVAVSRTDHAVTVSIEDNGNGFAPEEIAQRQDAARGLGLLGMQERVAALGGVFAIHSEPGQGTRLRIEIPLQDA
ncbi:MAG: PAS domain S-box protein [Anaerolineae bacterium]